MIRGSSGAKDPSRSRSSSPSGRKGEAELSTSAAVLWRKGNFAACASELEQLSSYRAEDPKVRSNLAAARALKAASNGKEDATELETRGTQDSALLLLNTASVLCNSKRYSAALKLLKPLWKSLCQDASAPDEVAVSSSLLLIDILFALGANSEAAGVLAWLEQRFELSADDKDETESKALGTPEQGQREDSIHSGDFSQQVSPTSAGSADQVSKATAGYDILQLVLSYRARLHMLAGDLRGAKRDLRSLLATHPRQSQAWSLKAELEALRGNFRRAAKLVAARPEEGQLEDAEMCQMLCNMGCIQHHEGKHRAAVLCYARASRAGVGSQAPLVPADSVDLIQPRPQYALETGTTLLYNLGLQALHIGQPESALRCFQDCAVATQGNPLLWLRMAECCVEAAVDRTPLQCRGHDSSDASAGGVDDMAGTLCFGIDCAKKAVRLFDEKLLDCSNSELAEEALEGGMFAIDQLQSLVAAAETKAWSTGKLSALSVLAFLNLQMGLPAEALQHAAEVLQKGEPQSQTWQTSQVYASEALLQLGRAQEAASHLQSALAEVLEHAYDSKLPQGASNGSVPVAGEVDAPPRAGLVNGSLKAPDALLCVNLASTLFSLDDFSQAEAFGKAGREDVESRDALLMHAYLQLCRGETGDALKQLKRFQLG